MMNLRSCALFTLLAASSLTGSAQVYTVIHSFQQHTFPSNLIQGRDGDLWGNGFAGGAHSCGASFKLTTAGQLYVLSSFDCTAEGRYPVGGLVLGQDNFYYGLTVGGGINDGGTVFRLSPIGKLSDLNDFPSSPYPGPLLGPQLIGSVSGGYVGVIQQGPAPGCGSIFNMTHDGIVTTLHVFDGVAGCFPNGLVQGTDNNFYGTTETGGAYSLGTAFKITSDGTFTLLHSFGDDRNGGIYPNAALVQGRDGNFYGTTVSGGMFHYNGTVFKMTPSGTVTTIHSFNGDDGSAPDAPLILATDGNFYGSTSYTLFRITPEGVLTTLRGFTATADGYLPGALLQHTSGMFYGILFSGGASGGGTAFSLDMGLGAFVTTRSTQGAVGAHVQILGTGLTGATAVTFNGVPATFIPSSDTFMVAIVPAEATTGPVQVTTPNGVLTSNLKFRVAP